MSGDTIVIRQIAKNPDCFASIDSEGNECACYRPGDTLQLSANGPNGDPVVAVVVNFPEQSGAADPIMSARSLVGDIEIYPGETLTVRFQDGSVILETEYVPTSSLLHQSDIAGRTNAPHQF